ncbi:MAG: DUF2971 domain-containing protein [Romboutsia sp.]
MEFTMHEYLRLINNDELNKANEYRIENIPTKLYKYIGLNDVPECSYNCSFEKLNECKLDSLKNNELWLSTCQNFNDPFELKTLFIDEDIIIKNKYPIELVNQLKDSYYNGFLIGCFTTNLTNNMPMWAHYASNHTGFCVEYKINKPKFFYPISYELTRAPANTLCMKSLYLIRKYMNNTITDKEKKDLNFYNSLLFHNSIIKNKSWEYENEYRLLYSKEFTEKFVNVSANGVLLGNNVIGIETTGIYLGISCEKYKDRLIEIGSELGVDVYQMYFDDKSETYELSFKKEV